MVLTQADDTTGTANQVPPVARTADGQLRQPDSKPDSPIAPTRSRAIPIWLALICIVLISLYLQTRTFQPSYNFLVEGNELASGADVLVDGQKMGQLSLRRESKVKVIGLRMNLADGTHHIEVIKPGCLPFSTQLLLHGEDYLGVELKKK